MSHSPYYVHPHRSCSPYRGHSSPIRYATAYCQNASPVRHEVICHPQAPIIEAIREKSDIVGQVLNEE